MTDRSEMKLMRALKLMSLFISCSTAQFILYLKKKKGTNANLPRYACSSGLAAQARRAFIGE